MVNLIQGKTNCYDDISINHAADNLIKSYEVFVEPFFNKFNSLSSIEIELNSIPIKRSKYMTIEKHVIAGLILCKKLEPASFDIISKAYETYLQNSN